MPRPPDKILVVEAGPFAYLFYHICQPLLCPCQTTKIQIIRNVKTTRPALGKPRNTTPRKSINSRDSKRFENARECTSATRTSVVCTTWFLKFSITQSTNTWRVTAQKLR